MSAFDGELVAVLSQARQRGRDDHPVAAMWNLLAMSLYLRHGKHSELLGELGRNRDLARVLGFREIHLGIYDLPSDSAVSRFHQKLQSETFLPLVTRIFEQTVEALTSASPDFARHLALDATDVRTHAAPPRRNPQDTEGPRLPSSDPEASWSVKTKKHKSSGEETKCTFGYKAYLVVDTAIPAVAALSLETGKASDHAQALPLLESAQGIVGEGRVETVAMDKGFDSQDNVLGAYDRGVAAICPVREVSESLQGKSREDREQPLEPQGNIVYDPYEGTIACYAPGPSGLGGLDRRQLKYAGFERDRSAHKFRCPLGADAEKSCPAFTRCAAKPAGSLGRQVRVGMARDPRRLAPVYPRSRRWQKLYNGRSAVERVNSYFKEVLLLERHALRGKRAILLRVTLASLALNVRTLVKLAAKENQAGAA